MKRSTNSAKMTPGRSCLSGAIFGAVDKYQSGDSQNTIKAMVCEAREQYLTLHCVAKRQFYKKIF